MIDIRAGASAGGMGNVDLSEFSPGTPAFWALVMFVGLIVVVFIVVGSLL